MKLGQQFSVLLPSIIKVEMVIFKLAMRHEHRCSAIVHAYFMIKFLWHKKELQGCNIKGSKSQSILGVGPHSDLIFENSHFHHLVMPTFSGVFHKC